MTSGQTIETIKSAIYANIANTLNAYALDPTIGVTIIDAVRSRLLEDALMQTTLDLNSVTNELEKLKKEKEEPAEEVKPDA